METGGAVIENNRKISTTDSRYTGYYDADACPYGETSNASKQFWGTIEESNINTVLESVDEQFEGRYYTYTYTCTCTWSNGANGYENTKDNSYQATGSVRIYKTWLGGEPNNREIERAVRNNISQPYRITNTREEQYVGGLQYAVEMASRAARDSMRRLEVWASGGIYTDYKGFVIRDSVTVKGGFPDVDTGCPGESERRPLLAKGIPLNDENSGYADRIADYETILQIQIDSPVTVTDAVNGGYTASGNLPPNIRKYVLSQPDVCLPTLAPLDGTYSHGSTGTSSGASDKRREDYVKYNGALWDGFTIRHGFINGLSANRDGGAGVRLFQGASLKNCVVRNNYNNTGDRNRGGGIYCDSPDGTVENCFVYNNVTRSNEAYGGGRQRAAVEGYKPTLAALHKGADGLLQLCAGHGALAGHQTVGHDHGSGHFLVIICLQHTAGKAVCGGKQHIGAINAPQRVRHNGEGGAAAVCVEDIGVALPGGQHDLVIVRRFFGKKPGIERTISLPCRVLARDHFGDRCRCCIPCSFTSPPVLP